MAGSFLSIASPFLGLVFAVAGISKLRDPGAAALALVKFRLTRRVRAANGYAVGVAECAVAVALIVVPSSPGPYVAAGAACTLFVVVAAAAVRRGERFQCACFGSNAGVSSLTAIRASLLLVVAVSGAAVAFGSAGPSTAELRLAGMEVAVLLLSLVSMSAALAGHRPFSSSIRESAHGQ